MSAYQINYVLEPINLLNDCQSRLCLCLGHQKRWSSSSILCQQEVHNCSWQWSHLQNSFTCLRFSYAKLVERCAPHLTGRNFERCMSKVNFLILIWHIRYNQETKMVVPSATYLPYNIFCAVKKVLATAYRVSTLQRTSDKLWLGYFKTVLTHQLMSHGVSRLSTWSLGRYV